MAEAEDIGSHAARHQAAHPVPSLNIRELPINLRILEGMIPMGVFWVAGEAGAPGWLAILLSLVSAAVVFVRNKEYGATRALSAIGFVVVASSAVAGIALHSEKTFAAQNIFGDLVFIGVGLGSIAIGRPIAGAIVREMFPTLKPHLRPDDAIFVALTLVVVVANAMQAGTRLWMIEEMSTNDYVLVSRLAGLPFNAVYIGAAYGLIAWRLRQLRRLPHYEPAKLH